MAQSPPAAAAEGGLPLPATGAEDGLGGNVAVAGGGEREPGFGFGDWGPLTQGGGVPSPGTQDGAGVGGAAGAAVLLTVQYGAARWLLLSVLGCARTLDSSAHISVTVAALQQLCTSLVAKGRTLAVRAISLCIASDANVASGAVCGQRTPAATPCCCAVPCCAVS